MKLGLDKKGYVQIDFVFAVFIFFLLFIVVDNIVDANKNAVEDSILSTQFKSDARDLCLFLKGTEGNPQSWVNNLTTADYYGFKNINNEYLNGSKFTHFNSTNYFTIVEKIGFETFLLINIEGLSSNTNYLNFGTGAGPDSYVGTYSCYGNYNNEVVRILVEVWK